MDGGRGGTAAESLRQFAPLGGHGRSFTLSGVVPFAILCKAYVHRGSPVCSRCSTGVFRLRNAKEPDKGPLLRIGNQFGYFLRLRAGEAFAPLPIISEFP